jgi:hypothetical protein
VAAERINFSPVAWDLMKFTTRSEDTLLYLTWACAPVEWDLMKSTRSEDILLYLTWGLCFSCMGLDEVYKV